MPIYEYECEKCGSVQEVLRQPGGKSPKKCKNCGGKTHKIISQCTFALKGSGWYADRYDRAKTKKEKDKTKQ
jgi:putative FmdB family regulatory protein